MDGYFGQTQFWMKPGDTMGDFADRKAEAQQRLHDTNWQTINSMGQVALALMSGGFAAPTNAGPKQFSPKSISTQIGTMSNSEVRTWYNQQLKSLNTKLEPNRANAVKLHNHRNSLKSHARLLMKDRNAAKALDKNNPLNSFEYYEQKYRAQGFRGEALWNRIIQGSGTPNAAVNQKFGL